MNLGNEEKWKKNTVNESNMWLKVGLVEPGTRVGYRQFFWHNISMLLGLDSW